MTRLRDVGPCCCRCVSRGTFLRVRFVLLPLVIFLAERARTRSDLHCQLTRRYVGPQGFRALSCTAGVESDVTAVCVVPPALLAALSQQTCQQPTCT